MLRALTAFIGGRDLKFSSSSAFSLKMDSTNHQLVRPMGLPITSLTPLVLARIASLRVCFIPASPEYGM